ncbi:MAG: PAS domain S-box protein [Nitrospirae bacterium]|nr:PAS domain S-box protein [Nitrospirota bacterium]MDA8339513.1 PAS domain S-box protein [Nitrospiraceae bacterium]
MRQTELHPKEDAEFYASVFKEHIQKGDAVQTDLFVAHKDGGKIPVEISASVSEIKGRKIITGIFRDITERKKTEEKMILQERLAAVGHLAAGIAHDFNNLLTGIIGYTDLLLLDTELSPDARQMAETISQGGRSAAQLIRQILDFSRKSASEMKLFDLKPFIKEFLKLIKKLIPENIRVSRQRGSEYI